MKRTIAIIFTFGVTALLSACTSAQPSPTSMDQLDLIRTAAARTVEAMTTEIVAIDQAGQTATAISLPLFTATPEPTLLPENPAAPSVEPNPTSLVSNTPEQGNPCNLAGFVSETVPDGSLFTPGSAYTKTWTLRNEGSCTWTKDYDVVFVGGSSMNTPASQALTEKNIAPGETVTISMPLTAPVTAGAFRAEFKLRSADGVIFAFKNVENTFWIEIQVRGDSINLADSFCSATWTNGISTLPCPGKASDSRGFVYSDPEPLLENGAKDNEAALWLGLRNANDSYLQATFPAMVIPYNARFTTVLGCLRGNTACDVEFSLHYLDSSGNLQELGKWTENHNGQIQHVMVDLSSFGGRQTTIVLRLKANGSPAGDVVHLLKPMIQP